MSAMRLSSPPAENSGALCTYHAVCWNFGPTLRAPLTTRRFRRTKPSSSTAGREVARRWSARPSKTSATNRSSMPAGLRTWPTPAWRRSRRNSLVDGGDGLDLDHCVGVGEATDLNRRAGRRGGSEIAQPHVAVPGEFLAVGDVGIGLDDVGEGGADLFETGLDILADLLDLRVEAATARADRPVSTSPRSTDILSICS